MPIKKIQPVFVLLASENLKLFYKIICPLNPGTLSPLKIK